MSKIPDKGASTSPKSEERRTLLSISSNTAMLAGLAGGYGAFALIAGRYLYPAKPQPKRWMFVARAKEMKPGNSLLYRTPDGATINIARQGNSGSADDFVALSSVCPHLGCQVRWEPANDRFFCPCHNGTFDPAGLGTGGPPGDAGQSLPRYPLKIEKGLLYIEAPVGSLTTARAKGKVIEPVEVARGPGHDPCLARGRGPHFRRGEET